MTYRSRSNRDAGFTLVELGVALALLALLATGVCALLPLARAASHASNDQMVATWLAVQRLEDLRALAWTVDASGAPESDTATDVARDPIGVGGTGLAPSPADALDVNRAGFVDYLGSDGRWVGTGPTPPPSATFIRRWRITSGPTAPTDHLLLEVLVTTVRRDRRLVASTTRTPALVEALVSTFRTRAVL